jgi:excisionase family DNA binding protein
MTREGSATIQEACEFLRISRPTFMKIVKSGRLKYLDFGGSRIRRVSWLDLYKLTGDIQ